MPKSIPEPGITRIPPYSKLAPYYDNLMDYIDYELWVEDVVEFIKSDPGVNKILDVSCGTGSMAVEFAKRGFEVTAMDLSAEMVNQARRKVAKAGVTHVTLGVGDMRWLQMDKAVDLIINLHDGLNYLSGAEAALEFLVNAHSLLRPKGWLIADVATPLLCQTHFNGYQEIFTAGDGGYERITTYDEATQRALTRIIFRVSEDKKLVEEHWQRAYALDEVKLICEQSPFSEYQIIDDEDLSPATETSERFYVILRK